MGGLLPKTSNDNYWVNTPENGGQIIRTINKTGTKTIKILSNVASGASIAELSIYCNYTVVSAIIYAQGTGLKASKTIKDGDSAIQLVLKNGSIYVTVDSSSSQMTVALNNISGGHEIIMESSDDDLSSPAAIIEF